MSVGAGPPQWYEDKLREEEDERRERASMALQRLDEATHTRTLPIAKHHRVYMEVVRTIVPVCTLVLQVVILCRQ